MSAYAALVSLRQNLKMLLYHPWGIIHNRAQLGILLEDTSVLLNFLDGSSTCKECQVLALETKIRDAAHKAEDLIENGILDRQRRKSLRLKKMAFMFFPYMMALISLSGGVWIEFFLGEVVLWAICSVGLYLDIREIYVVEFSNSQELERVLYDFKIIKDAVQIQRAHGKPGVAARALLISLQQILNSILDYPEPRISRHRPYLECLHQKVSFLLDFLGNASAYNMSTLQNLDATVRDASYKAKKALIQFQHPPKSSLGFHRLKKVFLVDFGLLSHAHFFMIIRVTCHRSTLQVQEAFKELYAIGLMFTRIASLAASIVVVVVVLAVQYNSEAPEKQELPPVIDDFRTIVKDVIKIPSDLPAAAAAESSRQDSGGSGKDVVVGLDSELIEIKARLLQHSSRRELVSIVGMGGIGKTTLAREAYKDPDILTHFDVRAWVTISQEYSLHNVLLCLLDSMQMLSEEKRQDSEEELGVYLHKCLMYRRYFIVMDDVWDTKIWEFLSRFLPENYKGSQGSRVLLTSRLPNVVSGMDSSSPLHHMQCLDENESWCLLREKIFEEESCPLDFEPIGKEIATSCRGLPLAIVVVGGLLYKDIQIEVWRDVAGKLKKSELLDVKQQCLEILGLSYKHLPHHLRPCFLYMGVFLADCEIPISRLINLWVAHGFLGPCRSKTLEEVAEGYLKDLIDRNLILICKRSCNGKIRTCSVHDLLRDVCVQNAHKENFFILWTRRAKGPMSLGAG